MAKRMMGNDDGMLRVRVLDWLERTCLHNKHEKSGTPYGIPVLGQLLRLLFSS